MAGTLRFWGSGLNGDVEGFLDWMFFRDEPGRHDA
jgi:hypothetical protein